MIFFLQSNYIDKSVTQKISYICNELNYKYIIQDYIPFEGTVYPQDKIIPIATIACIKDIKKRNVNAKVWCNWDNLKCSTYFSYLGKYILHSKYAFYTLAEIQRLKDQIFDIFSEDDLVFFKPDMNDKEFDGELIKRGNFIWFYKMITKHSPPLETLCLVSKPETILQEWRVFVSKGKVLTASCYKEDDCLRFFKSEPKEVIEFAEEIFNTWSPHDMLVVDIARTKEGLKLVEIGSPNMAGFYECDIKPIIKAMMEND